MSTPTPASTAAIALGCTCPTEQNYQGNRTLQGIFGYWSSTDCPVHGPNAEVIDVTLTTRRLESNQKE